jgi:hypothetical protein
LGAEVILVRAQPVVLPLAEALRLSRDPVGIPEALRTHHEVSLMERAYQLRDVLGYRPRFRLNEGEPASVLLKAAEERGGIPITGATLRSPPPRNLRRSTTVSRIPCNFLPPSDALGTSEIGTRRAAEIASRKT